MPAFDRSDGELQITYIDVKATFKQNLQDPYCRYVIVRGMQDELAGKELDHIPVDDLSNMDDLIWFIKGGGELMEMPPIDDEETPVEKLMPFTKLEYRVQQRVLYRAYVGYRRWFGFRDRTEPQNTFKLIYFSKEG